MSDTITIGGRTFHVQRDGSQYVLKGARGARYRALRSIRRAGMLYLTNDRDWTKSAPKCRLTDKSGTLEVA